MPKIHMYWMRWPIPYLVRAALCEELRYWIALNYLFFLIANVSEETHAMWLNGFHFPPHLKYYSIVAKHAKETAMTSHQIHANYKASARNWINWAAPSIKWHRSMNHHSKNVRNCARRKISSHREHAVWRRKPNTKPTKLNCSAWKRSTVSLTSYHIFNTTFKSSVPEHQYWKETNLYTFYSAIHLYRTFDKWNWRREEGIGL